MIENLLDITNRDREKTREYYQKVAEIETAIDTSLRSKLISPFPIYIIGIIQHYVTTNGKTVAGSNNFVYDLLVRTSLANISESDSDYSINETFLSQLAFKMLSEDVFYLDEEEMHDFAERYIHRFAFRGVVNERQLIDNLLSARIITFDGVYTFKHKHLIYYFSAKFLKKHRTDDEQRKFVNNMLENLDSNANLNTVAFMVYLNSDYKLVEDIMAISERETMALPVAEIGNLKRALASKRELIDDAIITTFNKTLSVNLETEALHESVTAQAEKYDPHKVLANLRILDLVGEIAKNHVGSWEGPEKAIVVDFCYRTSQKIIGHLYYMIDEVIKEIVVSEAKKSEHSSDVGSISEISGIKKADLVALINRSVYGIYEFLEVGIINRVAAAVGTSKMKEVYEEVLQSSDDPPAQMLDATIAMNTSLNFPEKKIANLEKKFREDEYHARMLRYLVRIHFMNYPTKQVVVTRVLGQLDEKTNTKDIKSKMLLRRPQA